MRSHTLAFTADQYARHVVRCFPRFGKRGVRPMPARMIGVVTCWAPLAMVALAAGGAVEDDLVWSGKPVLVNIEFGRFRRRRCRPGDESSFGCDLLQPGTGVAPHRQQRQTVNFLDRKSTRLNSSHSQ